MNTLTVRLTRAGSWWAAEIEEIPGCLSQGRTPASALVNLAHAMRLLGVLGGLQAKTAPKAEHPARGG